MHSVGHVIDEKSRPVLWIEPLASVYDALKMMNENNVGALCVQVDDYLVGIVSERDIVTAIARKGADVLEAPVSAIMTRDVQTCSVDERATALLRRMTEGRFRHLPVVENGQLHAVVSIGDVVKFRVAEIEMEKGALEDMVKGMYV